MVDNKDSSWSEEQMLGYFQGRADGYIEDVLKRGKPIAWFGSKKTAPGRKLEIIRILQKCLESYNTREVLPWVREYDKSLRYGFYHRSRPWALAIMDLLHRTRMKPVLFHSISGLVYGYQPDLIQGHIEKMAEATKKAHQAQRKSS